MICALNSLGRRMVLLLVCVVSCAPAARANDVEAFLTSFWPVAWGETFTPNVSGMSLSDVSGLRTVEAVDTNLGVVGTGTYLELASFGAPMLEFSTAELETLGALSVDTRIVAAWLDTSEQYSTCAVGMYLEVVLPDSPPGHGPTKQITFIPFEEHSDPAEAVAAAEELSLQFVMPPSEEGGGDPEVGVSVCVKQYDLCVDAAWSNRQACCKMCLAQAIAGNTACCVACLSAGPLAPVCCGACGVAALTYTGLCCSACNDNFNADVAQCQSDLLACDPSIVLP